MASHAGPPSTDQLIGQTIGNYLVTQKLGEGGMGSVYLAEHPTIGKKVALKVLHSEFASNAEVAARFFNEAKAVNDIGHPNIVDIVDFGILQGMLGREQLVYFIMEYLHGTSLSQLIRNEAPLPPERALGLALQVADALAASHKCGIVHRDLKPDNIILVQRAREKDFVKLLDFGIAKLTGENAGGNRTRTGIVMGTPAYMSPEQCDGKGLVDHRTDIYALGVLLYEMLTGRVPFIGEGYGEILVQHLTQRPAPPSQFRMLPPHVEIVVLKALEKRPDMRYPTMDEFMRAMADPVGYVEAHGGVGGFLQRQLMPSSAPFELPSTRLTPAALTPASFTPPPGSITPVPAQATTLGAASGVMGAPPTAGSGSRIGFWIAGVVVIAGAVAGIVFVASSSHRGAAAGGGSAGSAALVTPGSAGSAGSAVTVPHDTNIAAVFTTTPPGAEVFIDGVDKHCVTPCTLRVPPSTSASMVSLRLEGYVPVSREIHLDQGDVTTTETLVKEAAGSAAPLPGSGSGSGSGSAAITPVPTPVPPPHTPTPTPTPHTPTPTPHTPTPTPHTPTPTPHTPTPHTPTPHTPTPTPGHHDADGTVKPGDI